MPSAVHSLCCPHEGSNGNRLVAGADKQNKELAAASEAFPPRLNPRVCNEWMGDSGARDKPIPDRTNLGKPIFCRDDLDRACHAFVLRN